MKRWFVLAAVIIAVVVVLGGIKGCQVHSMIEGFKAQGAPKFTVSTIKLGYSDWSPTLSAVGSLRAERGADLSLDVGGVVDAIQFKSGDSVKSGQLLLQLRAGDDIGKLESLKANAALAELNYKRDVAQLDVKAVSQATVDSDLATLRSAKAQVAEQQAVVDKKMLRAPFSGQLGIREVDLGQYLAPGTKIVTLQSLDPIFVDFTLPQQALAQLSVGQKLSAHVDAYPDRQFDGEISALDPLVDTDTRNIKLRATLKNPDHKLLPGMYASLEIVTGQSMRYLTLPQTAITFNPYGETVYVADHAPAPDGKNPAAPAQGTLIAKQVFVTTGAKRGDQIAVLSGLKEGDEVVTSGQMKLRNGAPIVINNAVQPANDAAPTPQEN